jgi:hypothetical protein
MTTPDLSTARVGDEVLVRGVITEIQPGCALTIKFNHGEFRAWRSEIHSIIPNPLAVGDEVIWLNQDLVWVIHDIKDGEAWLKPPAGCNRLCRNSIASLTTLTRVGA